MKNELPREDTGPSGSSTASIKEVIDLDNELHENKTSVKQQVRKEHLKYVRLVSSQFVLSGS